VTGGSTTRTLAVAAYAVVLLAWCWLVGIPSDPPGVTLWLWLLAICWRLDWSWRFVRDWLPWLVALVVYGTVRGLTDNYGFTPHVAWPVHADEWLARHLWDGETIPSVTLQHRYCGEPCLQHGPLHWWDYVASAAYTSHFLAGLTIGGVLWIRNRVEWLRWIRRYVTISFLALIGYLVFPMAPPWLAADDGLVPSLARISGRASTHLDVHRTALFFSGTANPTAAMPSLHCGFTFLIAFYGITRLSSPLRWLLLLYPVAMALTLVYSAEHYLVDTIMGGVIAALAMAIGALWDRWRPPTTVLSGPLSGRSPAPRR
jgi:hypothetical protein